MTEESGTPPHRTDEELVSAIRERPKQCPACGGSRLGWADTIVTPTMSKRICRDCGCKWVPVWGRGAGWQVVLIGVFLGLAGIYGCFYLYDVQATEGYEPVSRFYNFMFPQSWWPYVDIGGAMIVALPGMALAYYGIGVLSGKRARPRVIDRGRELPASPDESDAGQ